MQLYLPVLIEIACYNSWWSITQITVGMGEDNPGGKLKGPGWKW